MFLLQCIKDKIFLCVHTKYDLNICNFITLGSVFVMNHEVYNFFKSKEWTSHPA